MSSVMVEFLHALEKGKCLEDCFAALVSAVEGLGYDAVSYAALPQIPFAVQIDPIFLTSAGFSTDFLKHYDEADWVKNDFTVDRVMKGEMDTMIWADELKKGTLSQAQQDVIIIAREDYGLRNAISIPIQSDEKLIAGASIVSEQKDGSFSTLNSENYDVLKIVIHAFHDRVFMRRELRQQFYSPYLKQFSDIELKLMRLVVSGQRLKMSSELCGISPSRAGNILSSLYKRLDISNVGEFAYLIGMHDLLDNS